MLSILLASHRLIKAFAPARGASRVVFVLSPIPVTLCALATTALRQKCHRRHHRRPLKFVNWSKPIGRKGVVHFGHQCYGCECYITHIAIIFRCHYLSHSFISRERQGVWLTSLDVALKTGRRRHYQRVLIDIGLQFYSCALTPWPKLNSPMTGFPQEIPTSHGR